jgi:hypothetical protein
VLFDVDVAIVVRLVREVEKVRAASANSFPTTGKVLAFS